MSSIGEIEDFIENKISAVLPEDDNVQVGVAEHIPVFLTGKGAPFTKSVDDLARTISTRISVTREPEKGRKQGIISMIIARLLGR